MKTITYDEYEKIKEARYKLLEKLITKTLGGDYEKRLIHTGEPMRKGSPHKFDFYWDNPQLHGNNESKTLRIGYFVYIRGIENNIMHSYNNLVEIPKALAKYGFVVETFKISSGEDYEVEPMPPKGSWIPLEWPYRVGVPYTGHLVITASDTKYNVTNDQYKPKPDDIEVLAQAEEKALQEVESK